MDFTEILFVFKKYTARYFIRIYNLLLMLLNIVWNFARVSNLP
ncbi:conserved hypothetical protein [Treponema phagedenis]|uniref:Uncharacterized protein n=1 Tax=Treponema phagedenis TaxID=162 RepID=A0A0B7GZA1_TREPH|nr:hypothetical protein HMPREF9554_01915 [Treponema phagedenis F0421]CEM61986.1 conserved hypothetical protein [Treponema phagedenis]